MKHACALLLLAATATIAGCAAEPPLVEIDAPTGPQAAPGDPCNGVVPQLCAM